MKIPSACVGFREASDHLDLSYVEFLYIFIRSCFHDLTHDLMVTRKQLYRCTRAPLF
jgi:hypothetical protein